MLSSLVDGFSVLRDALTLLSHSWFFWSGVASLAGLVAVCLWRSTRWTVGAAIAGGVFLAGVVGYVCSMMKERNAFLCASEPERQSLSGVYEVEVAPTGYYFLWPADLTGFFQISASKIRLNGDGSCEVSSFPRRQAWGEWLAQAENREDLSMLEGDLVSVFQGTWVLERFGAYYGVVLMCGPDNEYRFYLGGENARLLLMPLNFASSLEAVTFRKKS